MSRLAEYKNWIIIGLATLVGTVLLGYKIYTYALPAASDYLSEQVPEAVYSHIGQLTLESLDEDTFTDSALSTEKKDTVNRAFSATLAQLGLPEDKFQLHFRHWDEGANAFALMNGAIVLTDDLVELLDEEAQLQAVLLHEIGHIEHKHQMKQAIRVSLFYLGMTVLVGDVNVIGDLMVETGTQGVSLSYSQDFEKEADRFAAEHLVKLSGSYQPLVNALTRLEVQSKESPGWWSTHPDIEQRLESISETNLN